MTNPSPHMRKILTILLQPDVELEVGESEEFGVCHVALIQGRNWHYKPKLRITKTTFGILADRQWIRRVRKWNTGGSTTVNADGRRVTSRFFTTAYRITKKGKTVL